jgi:sugar lactone lactonase YvrE
MWHDPDGINGDGRRRQEVTVSNPTRLKVDIVADARAELGEGPVWEADRGAVLWVDILEQRVLRTGSDGKTAVVCRTPSDVGAAVRRASGGYVLALRDGFWTVDDDGGDPIPLVTLEIPASMRFNDGKCDPAGRFLAGTMAYSEDAPVGELLRLETDASVTPLVDRVTVSNGLGWTVDGRTLYFVDSDSRRVDAFDYDPDTGWLGDRRTFVEVPPAEGYPDGLAVDVDGGVWVAMWGGRRVNRYSTNGSLDAVIDVPATHTTSCAFGGPDLDLLYITSARTRLEPDVLAAEPHAGGLFVARPGVAGVPVEAFGG